MASIPIHNETEYAFTEDMTQQIIRDAQEHFGEEVSSIRVQSGIERHALNARTREVRYAFSPQDFGFGHTMPIPSEPLIPAPPRSRRRSSRSDAEPAVDILPASFEDIEVEAEETGPLDTSLESLDAGRDEEEEEEDVFILDDQTDEDDEDDDQTDEDDDQADEDDDRFFDPDTYEA